MGSGPYGCADPCRDIDFGFCDRPYASSDLNSGNDTYLHPQDHRRRDRFLFDSGIYDENLPGLLFQCGSARYGGIGFRHAIHSV